MAVTARDVAREAGVSPATVSLVFRDKPGVGQATRERVREVARRMGYEYVGTGSPGRSETVQLVVYKAHGKVVGDTPFFDRLMQGVSDEVYRQNYQHLSISYYYEGQDYSEQMRAIQSARGAGLVLLATEMQARGVSPFERLGVPVVLLDSWFPTKHVDAIVIDNQRGAFNATNHLIRAGHHDIGYLHSRVSIRNFMEREDGWRQAMRMLVNNRFDTEGATVLVGSSVRDAYGDMCVWLDSTPHVPTAFFADNDYIAAGCIRALRDHGYRVPEDVSIVGFDDVPLAEIAETPLTTMAVPKERMGALAVIRLASLIRAGHKSETIRLSVLPDIVVRHSVAPPRA